MLFGSASARFDTFEKEFAESDGAALVYVNSEVDYVTGHVVLQLGNCSEVRVPFRAV
ncbi:MAG: hypothetical protein Q8902_15890 [Bacteroidota bacterium]|nr:hypothetical protein [Bacteroidota bacterium]